MEEVIGSNPIFSTKPPRGGFFMYYVYILYSPTANKYYTGQTDNLSQRVESHRSGISRYTAIAADWELVYFEEFDTRQKALIREREIKSMKSRKYIEQLVKKGD